MINLFAASVLNKSDFETIMVKFKNRDYEAKFPAWSLDDLKTDSAVEYIVDGQTGEILYDTEL